MVLLETKTLSKSFGSGNKLVKAVSDVSLLALVNGVLCLALGLFFFHLLERKAKKKGMVSHF